MFTGSVDLLVGKKRIYRAMPGAILGEFPVLDGELTNVVTATTREVSDIASIPYEQFRKIADEHPAIVWRNLARILALRIRDRNASEADWFGSFGELKVSNVIKLMSAVPTVWKVVVFTVAGLTALGAWYNWLWTVTKTVAKP